MPLRYHGPDGVQELIPAPLVEISRKIIRDEGQSLLRVEYTFTLTGTIVNIGTSKDSPNATTDGMEGILREQARIRRLFSTDGGRLEIEAPGGGGPNTIDAYCLVEDIQFNQGVWVNRSDYSIVLRSTKIEVDGDPIRELSSRSETWNVNENENGTFTVTHQLNAVGVPIYGASGLNDPLTAAKLWCYQRSFSGSTGGQISPNNVDSLNFTNLINPLSSDNQGFWNKATVEGVGPVAFSWQFTETFLYVPNNNYVEEFQASLNFDAENPRRVNVTANGTLVGLADKASNRTLRIANAKTVFATNIEPNLYTRLINYVPTGYISNPVPTTKQITYEETGGTLRYAYTFTAVSGNLIPNSVDESVSVNDSAPTDVFAQISVPGRTNGPVVQNMKTVTLPERTVTINCTLVPNLTGLTTTTLTSLYGNKPSTNSIVDALKPSAGNYYIKQDSEEWNPIKRQYSRVVSWTIQPEGSSVSGIPTPIHKTS